MSTFILVFSAATTVINICAVIWLAAVKITRLEVKVEPMWKRFIRKTHTQEDRDDYV